MARSRHSDKEKFCNDLNGPKTPKMSEQPLKTLEDFPTSKLNTRVRLPSPAPSSSHVSGTFCHLCLGPLTTNDCKIPNLEPGAIQTGAVTSRLKPERICERILRRGLAKLPATGEAAFLFCIGHDERHNLEIVGGQVGGGITNLG
jgi:hypothetical protein